MWSGRRANHFIGRSFFDGPADAASDALMLEVWLRSQYKVRRLAKAKGLQHDIAPRYFALIVPIILNNIIRATKLAMVHQHVTLYHAVQ